MIKSYPYLQEFFSFNPAMNIDLLVTILKDIKEKFLPDAQVSISLTMEDENLTELNFDELKENLKKQTCNILIYALNQPKLIAQEFQRFQIIFQFKNELAGSNGNYIIMLNDKQKNQELKNFVVEKLSLQLRRTLALTVIGEQMFVKPIFKERSFTYKEKYCFVLMPLSESWSNRIWKHLREITQKEGFEIKRADNLFGQNILEDIWKAINEASVIIADITNRNPNVLYEIGIAHTIGKNVILLTQDSEDIPFDFKHYRHLIYEDNTDGIEKLRRELPRFFEEAEKHKGK